MARFGVQLSGPGILAAQELISQIIALARQHGIHQGTLARRAGISAESLTRLKKEGRCRLATALALARVAGIRELVFSETPGAGDAAAIAARTLSAGRRVPVSAGELVAALSYGEINERYRAHLCGFFEELPVESVHDVVLDEQLDYGRLVTLATELSAEGETVEWLYEMAGDGLAGPA